MNFPPKRVSAALAATAVLAGCATAIPPSTEGQTTEGGVLERITVHGPSLAGNLEGDSADRTVVVYLPPSYAASPRKRYPVVYFLHGYTRSADYIVERFGAPDSIDRAIAAGAREMIVVFPDAQTLHNGSMYSVSPTTGDWESYVARDLVAYVDANYRTIPSRESRGLAGHSMGGYGTLRIGMKNPELYADLYAMSSCCLAPRGVFDTDPPLEDVATVEEAVALGRGERTTLAESAAWASNPSKPPFYLDLPTENGSPREDVIARYAANAPHAMLDSYALNLMRYDAIALDIGLADSLLGENEEMVRLFAKFGIAHSFETYEGDHTSHIHERFEQHVIPFFSERLAFE
jgi:enterochelin esterase-like enzyme